MATVQFNFIILSRNVQLPSNQNIEIQQWWLHRFGVQKMLWVRGKESSGPRKAWAALLLLYHLGRWHQVAYKIS